MNNVKWFVFLLCFYCGFNLLAQSKSVILGNWEVVKIKSVGLEVSKDIDLVTEEFRDKYLGNKDSALAINIVLGGLKSLIGTQYEFKMGGDLSCFNPNQSKIRLGKYEYSKFVLKMELGGKIEKYEIKEIEKERMILQIDIENDLLISFFMKKF